MIPTLSIGYYEELLGLLKTQLDEVLEANNYQSAKKVINILQGLYAKRRYTGKLVLNIADDLSYTIREYEKGE